jgi:cell division septal protein FtsQ
MKRQKNKKVSLKTFLKGLREAVAKRALSFIVIAIFLAILFLLGKAYLYRSDYFRLMRVEIKESFLDQKSLRTIKHRILNSYNMKNVFALNLKAIAQTIQNTYPDAKDISVSLALPDKLVVGLKWRKAVAIVKADKVYPVDEDGVILPVSDTVSLKWVPVVEGVRVRPEDRKKNIITSRNLKAAINLLRNIKDIKPITDYGVDKVDAGNLNNIIFYLRNGIEVRMGSDDFGQRLEVLAKTLKDPRMMMGRIKYIDLRFGDAVIGPR